MRGLECYFFRMTLFSLMVFVAGCSMTSKRGHHAIWMEWRRWNEPRLILERRSLSENPIPKRGPYWKGLEESFRDSRSIVNSPQNNRSGSDRAQDHSREDSDSSSPANLPGIIETEDPASDRMETEEDLLENGSLEEENEFPRLDPESG